MMILRDVKAKRLTVMPPTNGTGFVLHWVGATFLLWVLGIFLVTLQAVMGMVSFFALGLAHLFSLWVLVLLAGATLGWLSGMLQNAVLAQGGKVIPGWQTATIVGGTIGVPLALLGNHILANSGLDRVMASQVGLWLPLVILVGCMSAAQAVPLFLQRRQAGLWVAMALLSGLAYGLLQGFFWPLAVVVQAVIQSATLWHLLKTKDAVTNPQMQAAHIYANR